MNKLKRKIHTTFLSVLLILISRFSYCDEPKVFYAEGKQAPEAVIPEGWEEEIESPNMQRSAQPSENDIKKGYTLFKTNYLKLINENTHPPQDEEAIELNIFTSLGEYEPITFAVMALDNLYGVKVKVEDLVSIDGNIINRENFDVRVVRYFPKQVKTTNRYKFEPLLLERKESITIKKNTTKQYWLTIYCPENAKPGDYITTIKFEPEIKQPQSIKLKVKVLPVRLERSPATYSIYYNIDSRWKGFYPGNIKKHFTDIKEHGLNSITMYSLPQMEKIDTKIKLNFSKLGDTSPWSINNVMNSYLEAGLSGPIVYTGLDVLIRYYIKNNFQREIYSEEFDDIYSQVVKSIKLEQEDSNWPEFLFSPADEPAESPESMRRCKYYLKLLKETVPTAKTYVTLTGATIGMDDAKILEPWLDVRCYYRISKQAIQYARKAGRDIWVYNGGSFGWDPLIDRFFYGFYAIKISADGVTQWAYQWPSSSDFSPSDELKSGGQGWYYAYPSFDGPVPTLGWEGIREGIDDAKYFYTLKTLIQKARNLNKPALLAEASRAEENLNVILNQIDLKFPRTSKEQEEIIGYLQKNISKLDEWRWTIAENIIKLKNLMDK